MRDVRLVGPLSGVLFVILFVLTVVLVGDTGDGPEDTAQLLADEPDRFFMAFLSGVLSSVALLAFFAWLRELVRGSAPGRRLLAALVVTPAAATAALLSGSLALMSGAGEAASRNGITPEIASFAMDAQYLFLVSGFMFAGLAVLCASLGLMGTGVLPGWVCWAGVVAAALQLVAFAFLPMLVLVLWVLVAATVLLVRRERPPTTA